MNRFMYHCWYLIGHCSGVSIGFGENQQLNLDKHQGGISWSNGAEGAFAATLTCVPFPGAKPYLYMIQLWNMSIYPQQSKDQWEGGKKTEKSSQDVFGMWCLNLTAIDAPKPSKWRDKEMWWGRGAGLLFQNTWLESGSGRIHTWLSLTPMHTADVWVNRSIPVGSTSKPPAWLVSLGCVRPTEAPVQILIAIAS